MDTTRADRDRPLMILASTTAVSPLIREELGSSAYSYHFALEALRPALEKIGAFRQVDRPESRLDALALAARRDGYRPIHLAVVPPQECYLSPTVPNLVFPFWEFPEVPDRDFRHDTRQNWVRTLNRADAVVVACEFTAEAIRSAGVLRPVHLAPIPVAESDFPIEDWDPDRVVTLSCRHLIWGEVESSVEDNPIQAVATTAKNMGSRAFGRIATRLDPKTAARIYRLKQAVAGKPPGQVAYVLARAGYNRSLRKVLSPRAVARVTKAKESALRAIGREGASPIGPRLPIGDLRLDGPVFTCYASVGDERKNLGDLLTAFLIGLGDRPDATLVLKLASSPRREADELAMLRGMHDALGIRHKCRVVAIADYLEPEALDSLTRSTAFYVQATRAEGACLPLRSALAAGRPGISPRHTAMLDYHDDRVGLVVRSHPEPCRWPHDPDARVETTRHRLVWSDLRDSLRAAYEMLASDRSRYRALSAAARRRMAEAGSVDSAVAGLRAAIEGCFDREGTSTYRYSG